MDHGQRQSGSFSRTSSLGPSLRRNDIDNAEIVDSGDPDLQCKMESGSGSFRFSVGNSLERGGTREEEISQPFGFSSRDLPLPNAGSLVTPLPEGTASPLSTDALVHTEDRKAEQKNADDILPKSFEYISYMIHLAIFGILGVITRYLLQKLFGPSGVGVTSDQTLVYLDLPSNMLGSFLMGWWGVVYKGDIARISNMLAIGLTTGYLGSLTTFSGWNQKMLDLSVNGLWGHAVGGFLIGLMVADWSIGFGIQTAKGFKTLVEKLKKNSNKEIICCTKKCRINSLRGHLIATSVMFLMLTVLWLVSALLLNEEFKSGSSKAQLWLGCLVGPVGVWIRWLLARLNGRGVGKERHLKWVPFGTLIANVSAACIMAALATLKKAVNTGDCTTVASGIQLGLMGCLSTVSTFIAEFHAMLESEHPWRGYLYFLFTIGLSFSLGTLIYSIPVWALHI